MEGNKVLYISQEIMPYLPQSPMAEIGNKLPQGIQEKGFEVRTFMPKYGCVNERRNQLHEVIRLSGMNLIIDDNDHPLIIKVATLQPARLQVYFIYNDDFFTRNINDKIETEMSPDENDERSIFYIRGALETVKKLRWVPNVIHCSGWISATTPAYLRSVYAEDPMFRDAKIVYSIFDNDLIKPLDARMAEKMIADGVDESLVEGIKDKAVDYVELTKCAIANSDGVIQQCKELHPEIKKFIEESGKKFLPYQEGELNVDSYIDFYKSL